MTGAKCVLKKKLILYAETADVSFVVERRNNNNKTQTPSTAHNQTPQYLKYLRYCGQ